MNRSPRNAIRSLRGPDFVSAPAAGWYHGFDMPRVTRKPEHLHDKKLKQLEERAMKIREDIIAMLTEAGSGHSAGPLGMADIFTALYFHVMVHDPKDPESPDRDVLLLSNGHICPVRYVTMAHAGYAPLKEMMTLRKFGSRFQGHPERVRWPALESTSGPLGSGLSIGAGMAYAYKYLDKKPNRVFVVASDGELEAGINWEAALFAGRNRLHNLTWIIDRNNIQIDGYTEDVMPLEPLYEKFKAFNFHVMEIDGHNMREFVDAVETARAVWERPSVIIARTIPGKGVGFMEFEPYWHGVPPKRGAEAERSLAELRTLGGLIRSEHE